MENQEKLQEDIKQEEKPVKTGINLEEFANKVIQRALLEMRKDFSSLAYRVFALELSTYSLLKGKAIPEEFKQDILIQEDIVLANVAKAKREALLNSDKKQEDKK
jgi:hypothetical protein